MHKITQSHAYKEIVYVSCFVSTGNTQTVFSNNSLALTYRAFV